MASPTSLFPAAPESSGNIPGGEADQTGLHTIPPIRWIMVGYFFWVGIFLGALIMHAATTY